MSRRLNPRKKVTAVGGNPPVAFMQDGFGYSNTKEYIGPCDSCGKLLAAEEAAKIEDGEKAKRARARAQSKAAAKAAAEEVKSVEAESGEPVA